MPFDARTTDQTGPSFQESGELVLICGVSPFVIAEQAGRPDSTPVKGPAGVTHAGGRRAVPEMAMSD